ncbi:amidase [Taklimakanibacter albus]|uniref:Amidase n=1 Tax=Taklimakanibacter albus TaxID=2800327 RepID=A0ACC5RAU9_9HYPH|nr:amidase [Aestuariivirga sp. YIM B02566]MBK1869498.1 amidase [Aestuariivirga sp. YIM B02566]
MPLPLHLRSALDQARLLRARKISARELLDLAWSQVEKHNKSLNAVIVSDITRARKAAAAADRRLKAGAPKGTFDGVPMTIKESFDWTGTPTTWGDPRFAGNIAKSDAVALTRLTDQGAVIFGKTNVPLMLADWQSFNAIYGTTNNPWDVTRSPGGSSGGSAVALATGMSALEIGSDIGASIRNPAHYCGVYGHKPTYGIVPMRGQFLPGIVTPSDISVAGPMARSARDLTAMLKLLAGPDGIEAQALQLRLPGAPQKSFRDFRVAVMLSDPVSEVDQPVQDLVGKLAQFLSKRAKRLSMSARPDFSTREAMDVYIQLLRSATSRRQSDRDFAANRALADSFATADTSYFAQMTRAYVLPHRSWLMANERRHQMRLLWDRFFTDWDVLICPAAASAAFPHDQQGERHERTIRVNGRRVATTDQLFWAGYSGGFYLPSTVAPMGLTPQGLPAGIQIITRQYGDLTALRFAELLEQEYCAFVPPPGAQ